MRRALVLPVALLVLPACRNCDDLGNLAPQAVITPPVLDLGPITSGATCPAVFALENTGNSDLETVGGTAKLTDTNGSFTIKSVPSLVRLGGSENIQIDYTAGATVGAREGTNFEVQTNDPDNEGIVRASVSAFVASAPVPLAKSSCADADGNDVTPCAQLDFGAVAVSNPSESIENRPGRNLEVHIVNDGNADLEVSFAGIDGGNPDFGVVGVRRGTQLFQLPVTVPAGRSGDCGDFVEVDNVLIIDVRYAPTGLGADADTLVVTTNGAEGATFNIPLVGLGSDIGILIDPEIVRFTTAEGGTDTNEIRVANLGTSEARVNESCIDLDGDDACDANCTGAQADAALGGALRCKVTKADGGAEGKGFVLAPTDAQAGGDDERKLLVTWAPVQGNSTIPSTAVVLFKSNILNNRVFKAAIVGGNIGELDVDSASLCADQTSFCIQAAGTVGDTTTWTGSVELTLHNVGDGTLTLGTIEPESDTPAAIANDFTIGTPSSTTLAPDATATVTVTYHNDDFSQVDPVNLVVHHDGALGQTLVPIIVLPPQ